ncbi:TadE-like [Acidimicrobiia bacterium]
MIVTRRGDRGQSTVELALLLPLVAILILLVLQFGLVLRDQLMVVHAAREAARAAAVTEGDPATAARSGAERAGSLDHARLDLTTTPIDRDERIRVVVRYRSSTDVPLVGSLLPDVDLEGTMVMMRESPIQNRVK